MVTAHSDTPTKTVGKYPHPDILYHQAVLVIHRVEKALGRRLSDGERVDLLLANLSELTDSADVRAVLATIS
jgi:hypothetical protein